MSSAAVSDATTQPRSSRPMTRGRMPWGSRAAYNVCSSMKTKQNAPRSRGSTSSAAASRVRSASSARSAVTRAVSVVLPRASSPRCASSPRRPSTRSRSSAELVRLPLWARATVPPACPPRVGWAFSQVRPTGRRVAAVADREVSAQGGQRALVEDLGHQPHVLVDEEALAVGRRDAGRLLPAVLEGVEAVVGELGDVLAGGPHPEDPAGVLRGLLAGHQVVGQASVTAWHERHSPTRPVRTCRCAGPGAMAKTAAASPTTRAPRKPR